MRIMFLKLGKDKQRVDGWIKAKQLTDTNIRDISEANLRELYNDEIILDVETKMLSRSVKAKLDRENWKYEQWDTQSRGHHYHLRVKGLENLEEDKRLLYREAIIKRFGADLAKKNGFIAMEHKPHLKSGKNKILLHKVEGYNKPDIDLIGEINRKLASRKQQSLNTSYDSSLKEKLRREVKVSDVLNAYNCDTPNFGNTMCPLDHPSDSKKCLSYDDDKGLWYCFNCGTGGDIYTMVMKKRSCTFKEALNRIKDGRY